MKQSLVLLLTIACFIILISCSSDCPTSNMSDTSYTQTNANIYIVTLSISDELQGKHNSNPLKNFFAEFSIDEVNVTHIYTELFLGFAAYLNPEQVIALGKDKRVLKIELDQEYSLIDELLSIDYDSDKIPILQSQSTPWGITAIGGFVSANSNTGVAWVVDTGIDLDHLDLNVNLSLSKTFVNRGDDAFTADDLNGHGTHVAGTIAALDNSFGVVGVCAGASVIAVKVLDSKGSGLVSEIVAGLDYIGKNLVSDKINAVNLSFGGSVSTTLDNAVKSLASKGAYVIIAAGNSRKSATQFSPARVDATNVFTISAHDNKGVFASFSNFGNPPIDFAAPGVSVQSTYKDNMYATMSGTSMATPHVTGILLANDGIINWNGTVTKDRDKTPDKKAVR